MPHQKESVFPTFHLRNVDEDYFYVSDIPELMHCDPVHLLLISTSCLYRVVIMPLNRCFRDVEQIKPTSILTIVCLACEVYDTEPEWLGPALTTEFAELVKRHASTHKGVVNRLRVFNILIEQNKQIAVVANSLLGDSEIHVDLG